MNNLITLVKMQLKEKLDFKYVAISKSAVFNFIVSALLVILKFAMVVVLCGAFIYVAQLFNLFNFNGAIPQSAISIILLVMLGASTLGCTVGLTKTLYYSRDNAFLLTLPAVPMQIFLSKIIIFFIFELKRNFSFLVPLFLAYFFLHKYAPVYYFWMLLCFVFVSMLTVALGALLSIPGMWLANAFNQHKMLQRICLVLIVALVILSLVYAISLIPADINIQDQLNYIKLQLRAFVDNFAYSNATSMKPDEYVLRPVYNMTLLLLGSDGFKPFSLGGSLARFGILLGIIALLTLASVFIVRPLFYKMASKPFEYQKKRVKERKNIPVDKKYSAFVHEFRIALKTPARMFSNIGIMISIPVIIYLLNKIFAAMSVRDFGEFMITAFNALIILLVALNANTYASSIYSRDGRSSYLIKTQPTSPFGLLVAKLVPNTAFVTVSFVITFFVVLKLCPLTLMNTVLFMLGLYFVYLTHLLYCAECDLMNPQTEIYATVGSTENNPNENKATALAFIAAFAIGIVILLLLSMRERQNLYLKILLVSVAAFVYEAFMFYQKIKLYYREK